LVGREQAGRVLDASFLLALRIVQPAQQDAVAELCTQAGAPSEEQSCAAQEFETQQRQAASRDAEEPTAELLVLRTPQSMVMLAQQALQPKPEESMEPQAAAVSQPLAEMRLARPAFQSGPQPADAQAKRAQ
jgi:hypothetical protein